MASIQELLNGRDSKINYAELISRYPWIVERDQNCIISPDSDGLLSALFMHKYLGWKVKGFYDGKILLHEKDIKPSECVFLDMEIFRKGVRSIGQHMVMYNCDRLPEDWDNFDQCISPNIHRGHDGYHTFRLKYPFGTIHFLIGILGSKFDIPVPESAIAPLLFTDGTWMNLYGYTENSLSWLQYMRAEEESPLNKIFMSDQYTMHESLVAMNDFLRKRDEISITRERGDRVTITLRGGDGKPHNLDTLGNDTFGFSSEPKQRAERFITLISELTGWEYDSSSWSWSNWKLLEFAKGDFVSAKKRLNNTTFDEFIKTSNPLSFAMTSGQNIEYTVEQPSFFF